MTNLILKTATRGLLPLLVLASVFLLLRGHNEPGGGFIAGLVAAAAAALCGIAFGVPAARNVLRFDPRDLIALGLAIAALSGLIGLLWEGGLLAGVWLPAWVSASAKPTVGTPVLFDVGVWLVVLGVASLVTLALMER